MDPGPPGADDTLEGSFEPTLAGARSGEEWAWTRIYQDLAPIVLGYLRGRGTTEPEDLLGEVFIGVVRDLPRFHGDERDFRAWVLTIAHRRLIDSWRRQRSRPATIASATDLSQLGPVADAESEAMERLGTEAAHALLAGLTSDQREVLLLRIVADLTIEEIARVTGRRRGAVKALQRRALDALRRSSGA